jgi:ribulose 1,5-bisphosphate carboxylase large subunit-like protein
VISKVKKKKKREKGREENSDLYGVSDRPLIDKVLKVPMGLSLAVPPY